MKRGRFGLTISTENEVFSGVGKEAEIARILRAVAERIERGFTAEKARDINGNTVGEFRVTT